MRVRQKNQLLDMIRALSQVHTEIVSLADSGNVDSVIDYLTQCQTVAIDMGTLIENLEGEGTIPVKHLEEYCESLFDISIEIQEQHGCNAYRIEKKLRKILFIVENSIKNDIVAKKIAVFLPYKVSMWDSLESIWAEAEADPNCQAIVIPIPYFDRNSDGSFGTMYYEGDMFEDSVSITNYEEFDFACHPDMIFIHNPFDDSNYVTSIHPFFYSSNIKKYTDCLVYVPYYATSGGCGEAYYHCPAYDYTDYILIQAPEHRQYYDVNIDDSKFLMLGSPKFDSIIGRCANPPEVPSSWKTIIYNSNGLRKKTFFYNTSIAGMLHDTSVFLDKMEYVFDTFRERRDVCFIWRPHPLLESTLDRLRSNEKKRFEEIRDRYRSEGWGIYDETPSIENTIANSDIYIGDSGTSVTALFGVVGKPVFILNNMITKKPDENDWIGSVNYPGFLQTWDGKFHDNYAIGPGNTLYYSPNDDYHYKYCCQLDEYTGGGYYSRAYEYGDKIYVFPSSAHHLLVVTRDKKVRKIELPKETSQWGAYSDIWFIEDVAYIWPFRSKSLVIFNMNTENVSLIPDISQFYVFERNNEFIQCARWITNNIIYILNPEGTQALIIDLLSNKVEIKNIAIGRTIVSVIMRKPNDRTVWLLPLEGTIVTRWDLDTDKLCEYDLRIDGIESFHRGKKYKCEMRIFGGAIYWKDKMIFAPAWGNKFVELDPVSGMVNEWLSPFDISFEDKSPYVPNWGAGGFIRDILDEKHIRYYDGINRVFYELDMETKKITPIDVLFDKDDVFTHTAGFDRESEWVRYSCNETVFNTLNDLINDTIHGTQFDKKVQIAAYADVNASPDGDCGAKTYSFLCGKLDGRI